MPPGMPNNKMSSIVVPAGMSAQLYQTRNFGGADYNIGSHTTALTVSFSGFWNNQVSSYKVRTLPSGSVMLCENHNCADGTSWSADGVGDFASLPTELGTNVTVSKVSIPVGYQVELFELQDFLGWEQTFHDPVNALELDTEADNFKSFKIFVP